jgi:phosphinothricin acetyltransferase
VELNIEFREAADADLGPLLEIYNYYVRTSTATFHIAELDQTEFQYILFPDYPRFGAWTLFAEGRAAGYVILARHKSREAFDGTAEVTVYLHPDFTGRSLGRAAGEFAESRARERGFHSLLASICAENTASVALFERLGYIKCAHQHQVGRKFDRWLDVVFYEKLLDHAP